jgi:hypothetical protein
MSPSTRILLVLLIGSFALVVTGAGIAATAAYQAGSIAVEVRDQGTDLHLAVPAALVHLALILAPVSLLEDAVSEAEPFLPAIRAGWSELERAPDFVLVEVTGPRENVRVEKRGGRIVVHVDEAGGSRVNVEVPMRTVRALISKLD